MCYIQKDQLIISIEDNGRGISLNAIVEKAIAKDLINSEKANLMQENEILDLIFSPSFSTLNESTLLSGRGIGLNAVRHEINKLEGSVSCESQFTVGSRFKISIPMKLLK
jgi:chemotaxis protein histidine kinase CheA